MNRKAKRKFSQEFKEEAVKLVTEQGYKISEAARNLDIGSNMLSRWKRELEEQKTAKPVGLDQEKELSRLREENRRLRMEREILKKAAAFFVNEMR
jgi:transposase